MKKSMKTQENLAVFFSILTIIIGYYLAKKGDPTWINRSGSVLIVIGILLGASRLPELIRGRAERMMKEVLPKAFEEGALEAEKIRAKKLTAEEKSRKQQELLDESVSVMNRIVDEWQRRMKRFELVLVVVGTMVNGFGDWLFKLI